jgi:hypothetical protein
MTMNFEDDTFYVTDKEEMKVSFYLLEELLESNAYTIGDNHLILPGKHKLAITYAAVSAIIVSMDQNAVCVTIYLGLDDFAVTGTVSDEVKEELEEVYKRAGKSITSVKDFHALLEQIEK